MAFSLEKDSKQDLYSIKSRFLKINRERIELTRQMLGERQAPFIDVLPLLFHENNPAFPGYTDQTVPAGISDYSSNFSASNAAKTYFKDYKPIRRARRNMDINALYFMGSSGSIAYNSKSDFDVWLLHSTQLDADAIDQLQQKAYAIEQWAEESLHLEVHFFIFSAEEFKQGQQQGLSTESSGSAQHYLLLDEFYRSSLLIAGKTPTWWLVPPEREIDYDSYLSECEKNNNSTLSDTIDFGSVANIPASEYFGAAVWQLYKSIHSPYKSLMKLLLIEVYACEHPSVSPLSVMFKQAVYDGIEDVAELDPYLMMYKKVEEHLMVRNQRERLELFRQCFYIKIKEPLSTEKKKQSWRRKIFKQFVLDWGWQQEQFMQMDTYKEWQIQVIAQQRTRLMNALTESYQFLSNFARQNSEVSRVSKTELNVLGRKLYAAFERKAGKVDIFNRNNDATLKDSRITISQKNKGKEQESWLMYQGHINPVDVQEVKPIKRTKKVLDLIAWAYFNKIIDSHSAISLHSQNNLTVKEIRQLLSTLEEQFPDKELPEADFNDLNQPAKVQNACLFVNVGYVPNIASSEGLGHVSSVRDNVLSYGGQHDNLLHSFDLLICTSWEELLIFHYEDQDALLKCITEYMKWSPVGETSSPPKLNIFSYSSSYGLAIIKRLEEIFEDVSSHYFAKQVADNTRYILEIEDSYYYLFNENRKLSYKYVGSGSHLLRSLGKPNNKFSPIIFDKKTDGNPLLQYIYKLNRPERIQLFYLIKNDQADIFILDENGSLFFQKMPFYDSQALINHFNLFFKATINRRLFLMLDTQTDIENLQIEFYSISIEKSKKIQIQRSSTEENLQENRFFNIQVIGSPDDEHNSLSIFCGEREFSLIEFGKNLFDSVAEYVIQQRANGQKYPIYITDIDLSRGLIGQIESEQLQTIYYLNYKKHIEDKLNKAIATS